MEFMSQYNAKIIYVKGEDNTVADALSCLPMFMNAEVNAKHAYSHCVDDKEGNMVTSLHALLTVVLQQHVPWLQLGYLTRTMRRCVRHSPLQLTSISFSRSGTAIKTTSG